ncbi:MAG: hypothetical protein SangKO_093470 [Sandaracinaceae bacterium]
MRKPLALLVLLLLPGCPGRGGPELPPDVGMSHQGGPSSGGDGARVVPEENQEPVDVGTRVWANYHDTGFYFHGVVVERREDEHRVIYGDGASEWLPAAALRPDALGEEARVHVRPSYEGEFLEATVLRRLGDAIYVHSASGQERWTALPHVRFAGGDRRVPVAGEPPAELPRPEAVDVGARVLVNYAHQGLRFVGTVTAVAEDGRYHVVYLDGESGWVAARDIELEAVGEGTIVHVRRTWEPAEWVRGRVAQRVGSALRVELDDGGVAWTSLLRIRLPEPSPAAPAAADDGASEAITPAE